MRLILDTYNTGGRATFLAASLTAGRTQSMPFRLPDAKRRTKSVGSRNTDPVGWLATKRFATSRPYILFILILALLLAACGGDNSNTPNVHQLIKDAQAAIQKVKSYHFNLQATNIGTTGQFPISSADGDIKVPDRLKATADISGNSVQIVAIGNQQYIDFGIGWMPITGLIDPRTLSDPQTGVSAILGHIQNPGGPTDSSVDGTSCWNVQGKLDPSLLAGITGGGAPSGQLDDVTTCIGKSDNLPYEIVITGPAAAGDNNNTVRTFKLSKFGEQIDIEPPATTA